MEDPANRQYTDLNKKIEELELKRDEYYRKSEKYHTFLLLLPVFFHYQRKGKKVQKEIDKLKGTSKLNQGIVPQYE